MRPILVNFNERLQKKETVSPERVQQVQQIAKGFREKQSLPPFHTLIGKNKRFISILYVFICAIIKILQRTGNNLPPFLYVSRMRTIVLNIQGYIRDCNIDAWINSSSNFYRSRHPCQRKKGVCQRRFDSCWKCDRGSDHRLWNGNDYQDRRRRRSLRPG